MFGNPPLGWENLVAEYKELGIMDFTEGKDAMPFAFYKDLCRQTMELDDHRALFCWAFLIWTWNLINRSITTAVMPLVHLGVEGDAMTVQKGRSKKDKKGANSMTAHVYANPSVPSICPVLALATFLFSQTVIPERSNGSF